jgi:hypothetical protein
MMQVYPHSSPIILNTDTFVAYGGQTGSFGPAQLAAAYLIAEKQATAFLNTFLLPTVVTGTFGYAPRIATDYGYVHEILSVKILSKDSYTDCTLQSTNGCVFVWDDTFGYLDVGCIISSCNCGNVLVPYQIQSAYRAGLPTGVANQPDVLLALTMAATISLNEMIYPSQNEGVGDIGIQEFRSLDYSEVRKTLKNTVFGNSAKAQKIAGLLAAAVKPARQVLMLR